MHSSWWFSSNKSNKNWNSFWYLTTNCFPWSGGQSSLQQNDKWRFHSKISKDEFIFKGPILFDHTHQKFELLMGNQTFVFQIWSKYRRLQNVDKSKSIYCLLVMTLLLGFNLEMIRTEYFGVKPEHEDSCDRFGTLKHLVQFLSPFPSNNLHFSCHSE